MHWQVALLQLPQSPAASSVVPRASPASGTLFPERHFRGAVRTLMLATVLPGQHAVDSPFTFFRAAPWLNGGDRHLCHWLPGTPRCWRASGEAKSRRRAWTERRISRPRPRDLRHHGRSHSDYTTSPRGHVWGAFGGGEWREGGFGWGSWILLLLRRQGVQLVVAVLCRAC
jgi:hypothetical protein